jgi:RNA polymerase sigma-70 factor (ECF subfamily)
MAEQEFSFQEASSFSQFYESFHRTAFRYIYGMTGGPVQEVEDITAETFYRAWKKRKQFSGNERAAQAWLLTIARNLVFDTHRRKKGHPEIDLHDEWFESHSIAQLDFEDNFEEQERFKILWQVVLSLQPEQREILVLRHMLGWQVKEIARLLNMEENHVSVCLHRIIKQIQQSWSQVNI